MTNYRAINLDMDGVLASLYTVDGWLDDLRAYRTRPYREAKPMVDMRKLGKLLNKLQENGYKINIISWLSKVPTPEYDVKVIRTKQAWLKKHLGAVHFDNIAIVPHGTPKHEIGSGILFDDEIGNRKAWASANENNLAFNESNILEILEGFVNAC